jgi:soluble lytic murein transglycosylase
MASPPPNILRLIVLSAWLGSACYAARSEAHQGLPERQRFLLARDAFTQNDRPRYETLLASLQDYPLLPYLRHADLQTRLSIASAEEVRAFLKDYADSPLAASLLTQWLRILAARQDWQGFLQDYQAQRAADLRCRDIEAHQRLGGEPDDKARKRWEALTDLPRACEPMLSLLTASGFLSDDMLWTKFKWAVRQNRITLAGRLLKNLNSARAVDAQAWLKAHKNPAEVLKNPNTKHVTPEHRELLGFAIERVAQRDPLTAEGHWQSLKAALGFAANEIARIQRAIVLGSEYVRDPVKAPALIPVLDRITPTADDAEMHEARLRLALKTQDWQALKRWSEQYEKPPAKDAARWRYWRARSLERTDKATAARELYRALSAEANYYGFLAAERLGLPYALQDHPIKLSSADETALFAKPPIRRAYELLRVGLLIEARREWDAATRDLDTAAAERYAALAASWGWHDRVIMTTNRGNVSADLVMRYPLAYRPRITEIAANSGLETAALFGFVRTESAFMADARSSVGALGLMQLMPGTGRDVAQELGTPLGTIDDLLDIDRNLRFGAAYARKMLDKFGGNIALAAAAYNAGPGRAKRWAAGDACRPLDLWVESIPLDETREYVKRILFNTTVYAWRLGEPERRMKDRATTIIASADPAKSAAECS